jgi:hypothetical protein
MKISKQCCTREQAGILNGMKVRQESAFIWTGGSMEPLFAMIVKPASYWVAAFNSAELSQMLPEGCNFYYSNHTGFWHWQIIDMDVNDEDSEQDQARGFKIVATGGEFDTEAEAKADCLITILESDPHGRPGVDDINSAIEADEQI